MMSAKTSTRPQPAPAMGGTPIFLSVGGITAGFRIVQGELLDEGRSVPYVVGAKRRVLVSEHATDEQLQVMLLEMFRACTDELQRMIEIRRRALARAFPPETPIEVNNKAKFACTICGRSVGSLYDVHDHVQQAHVEGRNNP